MTQIHIDSVYTKENNICPMIINFHNGYLTNNFKQECAIFENTKLNSKTAATSIGNLIYSGDEQNEDLGKTFLLVRNKETGKVRIIESGVLELKPVLDIDAPTPELSQSSNLELSRKFGSKKQKQQMEQREKLKVNIETVTKQMENVTKEISKDTLDLSNYNKSNSDDFYIPPIDREAQIPEEVYNINDILTAEQYEKIHSELDGKEYTTDMLPIVKDIVTKRTLPPKLLVLAVYANSLLQLYGTVVKKITKNFTICPHSITLNDIVLNNFLSMSGGKRTRPAPYKDKSLCHAIVFLLLINNLKIELDSLCEVLKLTATTASLKVRVTGATVVNSGSKKVVQLKLPLNVKSGFRRKSTKF